MSSWKNSKKGFPDFFSLIFLLIAPGLLFLQVNWLSKRFHLLNILNLDVAAGAVGMALLINYIFRQEIHPANYYLLFSAVWTIYLVDHLYDSRKPEAVSERRKFFKKYHRPFLWVLILNILLT